jgi:hypothetical protein
VSVWPRSAVAVAADDVELATLAIRLFLRGYVALAAGSPTEA